MLLCSHCHISSFNKRSKQSYPGFTLNFFFFLKMTSDHHNAVDLEWGWFCCLLDWPEDGQKLMWLRTRPSPEPLISYEIKTTEYHMTYLTFPFLLRVSPSCVSPCFQTSTNSKTDSFLYPNLRISVYSISNKNCALTSYNEIPIHNYFLTFSLAEANKPDLLIS